MSGRPWLEALKATMKERSTDTNETPGKTSESLSLEGCERCESLADGPTSIIGSPTAENVYSRWGNEERGLIAADWKPKQRGGLIIWANPETGFYYSQEVAGYSLKRSGEAL